MFLSTAHRRYLAFLLHWGKQFQITLYCQEPTQTVIANYLLSVITFYSATPSWALDLKCLRSIQNFVFNLWACGSQHEIAVKQNLPAFAALPLFSLQNYSKTEWLSFLNVTSSFIWNYYMHMFIYPDIFTNNNQCILLTYVNMARLWDRI